MQGSSRPLNRQPSVLSRFQEGFASCLYPLGIPVHESVWPSCDSFEQDQQNLRGDFVKSFSTVVDESNKADAAPLALNP